MLLPLKKLLRKGEAAVQINETIDLSGADFPGYTASPAQCTIKASPAGNAVYLAIELQTEINMPCARCLAPAKSPLHISKNYYLRLEDFEDECPELPLTADGRLDVEQAIYQEVLMEAPSVLYCKEDCQGLCMRCGKRVEDCTCPPQQTGDPRLQILKELLKDN